MRIRLSQLRQIIREAIRGEAPPEVTQAYETAKKYAMAAGEPEDRVYLTNYDNPTEFEIADNYEQMGTLAIYKAEEGQWYYRSRSGRDRPVPGGLDEVLAGAEIWFTG